MARSQLAGTMTSVIAQNPKSVGRASGACDNPAHEKIWAHGEIGSHSDLPSIF